MKDVKKYWQYSVQTKTCSTAQIYYISQSGLWILFDICLMGKQRACFSDIKEDLSQVLVQFALIYKQPNP